MVTLKILVTILVLGAVAAVVPGVPDNVIEGGADALLAFVVIVFVAAAIVAIRLFFNFARAQSEECHLVQRQCRDALLQNAQASGHVAEAVHDFKKIVARLESKL